MVGANEKILQELERAGMKARLASLEQIQSMESDLLDLKSQGFLTEEFYRYYLGWMNFDYAQTMPKAQSVLVMAYPQLMTKLKFEHQGEEYDVIVPPTYVYQELVVQVAALLESVLTANGYSYQRTPLPLKLLAVSSGLGMYGRNNICYVEGFGSFLRLFAVYTDLPCDENDSWTGKTMMPECGKCVACLDACPTGSITADRLVIDAAKCLTRFNETKSDYPDWIAADWHNAIIGCMKCQLACPQNRAFVDRYEREVTFTSAETALLLGQKPLDQLPNHLRERLDQLCLTEYYPFLHRNLSSLIR